MDDVDDLVATGSGVGGSGVVGEFDDVGDMGELFSVGVFANKDNIGCLIGVGVDNSPNVGNLDSSSSYSSSYPNSSLDSSYSFSSSSSYSSSSSSSDSSELSCGLKPFLFFLEYGDPVLGSTAP